MGDIYCIVGTDFRDGLGKSQSQAAARETGRSSEGVVAVRKEVRSQVSLALRMDSV